MTLYSLSPAFMADLFLIFAGIHLRQSLATGEPTPRPLAAGRSIVVTLPVWKRRGRSWHQVIFLLEVVNHPITAHRRCLLIGHNVIVSTHKTLDVPHKVTHMRVLRASS